VSERVGNRRRRRRLANSERRTARTDRTNPLSTVAVSRACHAQPVMFTGTLL